MITALRSRHLERLFYVRYATSHRDRTLYPAVTQTIDKGLTRTFEWSSVESRYMRREMPVAPLNLTAFIQNSLLTFLPKGYPNSVRDGYLRYAAGTGLGTMLSSAGGVLSLQSLLVAIGMGAGSIPLAATLNWIIKDGLGQLGGVLFASAVNNKFDAEPKRWRFIASVSLEFSSFLELLTPLAPHYFLPIAAVANIGKNISCLAASASRAAIHHSFAVSENLADVTAKAGSQTILCSTIGTGVFCLFLYFYTDPRILISFPLACQV